MSQPLAVESIVAGILEDVAARESHTSFQDIKERSWKSSPPRDAVAALLRGGCSVVVELKRALPYKGPIGDFPTDDISELARSFEQTGAHMIACQTEKLRFNGSLEDMWAVRQAVEVPVMIRDIIVDPYQIHEARFYGADIVPLQVELLGQARLVSLIDRIESLGMTAIAEVRSPEEADRALEAGVKIIGVNAWSINSTEIDKENFGSIVPGLPQDIVRIALGGVRTPRELLSYASIGADAVIVGEAIMASDDPVGVTRSLVAMGQHPACPSR